MVQVTLHRFTLAWAAWVRIQPMATFPHIIPHSYPLFCSTLSNSRHKSPNNNSNKKVSFLSLMVSFIASACQTRAISQMLNRDSLIEARSVGVFVLLYDGDNERDEFGPEVQVFDAGTLFIWRDCLRLGKDRGWKWNTDILKCFCRGNKETALSTNSINCKYINNHRLTGSVWYSLL